MIEIDGSQGEGGGQILRSALALSVLTGKPFRMTNIRAKRSKPGLRPQHLESVRATAAICGGENEGAALGSLELRFEPGRVRAGDYRFEIQTAGSTGLLLHAVYLPLALAGDRSRVVLVGGTHVKWSPSYHFLEGQWAQCLSALGLNVRLELLRCGFYPEGGGEISVEIDPWTSPRPIDRVEPGKLIRVTGLSAAPNLPVSIARRQANAVGARLSRKRYKTDIKVVDLPSRNRGSFVALFASYEQGAAAYVELGEIGRPAEKVGDAAARAVADFDRSGAALDEHTADQLLLPLSLVLGESRFSTNRVTQHLLTNARVIRLFLEAQIAVQGDEGDEGVVHVRGAPPETAVL